MLTPKARRVVEALDRLIEATISARTDDDPDSLGNWMEKQEFEEAFGDFMKDFEKVAEITVDPRDLTDA